MLPIIIGAVSLIAYGLFDENSKPKAVKKMAKGGSVGNEVYIEFLNKEKGFKKDRKEFKTYDLAVKWGRENFERFNPDMIRYIMAKGGNINNFDKIFEEYEENEDNNYHSENVVLLAKHFGSAEDLKLAKSILKKHESEGSISEELYKQRYELDKKLYPKLIASKNKMAKGGKVKERDTTIDREYRALKGGTRKSSKYASVEMRGGGVYHRRNANQYGKVKGGKTYTENRDNRTDAKPRQYLERGGHVSKGEHIWAKMTTSEKMDFLIKNFTSSITPRTQETLSKRAYKFLPKNVKIEIESKFADVE
jgi:hypothetical protein